MANSCNPRLQKTGRKTKLSGNSLAKNLPNAIGNQGSNQNRRVKCTSPENAQNHFHVGHTHQWISVLPSAGSDLKANNTCYLKERKNRKKRAGSEHASWPIFSNVVSGPISKIGLQTIQSKRAVKTMCADLKNAN